MQVHAFQTKFHKKTIVLSHAHLQLRFHNCWICFSTKNLKNELCLAFLNFSVSSNCFILTPTTSIFDNFNPTKKKKANVSASLLRKRKLLIFFIRKQKSRIKLFKTHHVNLKSSLQEIVPKSTILHRISGTLLAIVSHRLAESREWKKF